VAAAETRNQVYYTVAATEIVVLTVWGNGRRAQDRNYRERLSVLWDVATVEPGAGRRSRPSHIRGVVG
jgi:hypothetical protein